MHVEGLLTEIAGAAREVTEGGLGGKVAQFEAVDGDPSRDLKQAVAVVGDRVHGGGPVRVAAQRADVDEAADHGLGLPQGECPAVLRHSGQPSVSWRRSQRATVEWWTRTRRSWSQRCSSAVVLPATCNASSSRE